MYILMISIMLVGESAAKFSEWNSWSPCTVTCGSGVMSRERLSKFETCYSELSERKVCLNDPCIEHGNLTNVALGASVIASSVFLAAFPTGNVVDGDESTDFYTGTCTQTNKDDEPWLRIELNGTALIKEVVVFNRGDCCSERLNQMEITVGEDPYDYNNTLCGKRGVMAGVKMARVSCYEYIKGSYIYVRIPGPQYLALCEVQVYGHLIHRGEITTTKQPTTIKSATTTKLITTTKLATTTKPATEPTTKRTERSTKTAIENLALGKVAKQSSSRGDDEKAENAVDGNLCTNSGTYYTVAWLRVDMEKPAVIYKVRLYTDVIQDMPTNHPTTVTVGNSVDVASMTSCGVFTKVVKHRRCCDYAADITCTNVAKGRYVQVNKNSANGFYLYINEFEAYGRYL